MNHSIHRNRHRWENPYVSNLSAIGNEEKMRCWWPVVLEVAQLMMEGWTESEVFDEKLTTELIDRGYLTVDIERAIAWLEMTKNSGFFAESIGMLQPSYLGQRIMSSYETLGLPKTAISAIDSLRNKGIISPDIVEKLIEGLRVVDTRDWDDDEVLRVIHEFIAAAIPYPVEPVESLEDLERALPRYYS